MRGVEDRTMESDIVACGLFALSDGNFHVINGLPNLLMICSGSGLHRLLRISWLEHATKLQHITRHASGQNHPESHWVHDRITRFTPNDGSLPAPHLHDAYGLKHLDGLSNTGFTDAQALSQFALGRKIIAGLEFTTDQGALDPLEELHGNRAAFDGIAERFDWYRPGSELAL